MELIDPHLEPLRDALRRALDPLPELCRLLVHPELEAIAAGLLSRLDEPFLFVVVGEVKSGKSSFINALLGHGEICAVAPQPCTDAIYQVTYGEREESETLSSHLRRLYRPLPLLRQLSIVDTPGTNTIIEHHQEITERFIPGADLVIFVFEARNPYRQSAWALFDLIHAQWRRKVIFVLQQADLATAEELASSQEGLKRYAQERGLSEPRLFSVSAKRELDGEESGFEPLRELIRAQITGGQAPIAKLEAGVSSAEALLERLATLSALRLSEIAQEERLHDRLERALSESDSRARRTVTQLGEALLESAQEQERILRRDLDQGLGLWAVAGRHLQGLFRGGSASESWLRQRLEAGHAARQEALAQRLEERLRSLTELLQQGWGMIALLVEQEEIAQRQAIFDSVTTLRDQLPGELEEVAMRQRAEAEPQLLPPKGLSYTHELNIGGALLLGGTLFALLLHLPLGAMVAAAGLLYAWVRVTSKRVRIVSGYRKVLKEHGERLGAVVSSELEGRIDHYRSEIEGQLAPLFRELERARERTQQAEARRSEVQHAVEQLRKQLSEIAGHDHE